MTQTTNRHITQNKHRHRTQTNNGHRTQTKNRHRTPPKNRHITYAINEQRTVMMFALLLEAGHERRTSHNVRTPLGALDNEHSADTRVCTRKDESREQRNVSKLSIFTTQKKQHLRKKVYRFVT